jgi:hypothetical protein
MYGITIMSDSWTGLMGMSIMNFMVYCNGILWQVGVCQLQPPYPFEASRDL